MLFVEFRFLFYFLLVFTVHWTLRSNTARKLWLLVASHFFYACFFIGDPLAFFQNLAAGKWAALPNGWWFPGVLMASTCMDYTVGLGIDAARPGTWKRRAWLLGSLITNLGVLSYFKYFNFFVGSAAAFLDWMGLHTSLSTLQILLPCGISFYTFQSMSYSIDVYRGVLQPVRRFLDLAFFISFFPQLVAGPIVRAMTFLPQVLTTRLWKNVDARAACSLFLIGFIKKACVSDFVAVYADEFFAAPGKFTHISAVIGVFCYAVQIYCDFSGYTDMAIATSRLLGYELTLNFNFPYFAANIADFWRRWHISLSTWLRDYLYIPLGGNRGNLFFSYRNLMLTMLLGGLWHGASWNFVIWGGMHGFALVAHREWLRLTHCEGKEGKPPRLPNGIAQFLTRLSTPLTFLWVCLTWIFFRAVPVQRDGDTSGLEVALQAAKSFCFIGKSGNRSFGIGCVLVLATLATIHWLNKRGTFARLWARLPDWAAASALGAGSAAALLFVPVKYKPFIYFQF